MAVLHEPGPSFVSRRGGRIGRIFTVILALVFGLPFIGFGLMAVMVGVQKLVPGENEGWAFVIVGSVFVTVGALVPWAVVRKQRGRDRRAEIAKKFEHAPWLADEQWARGRIECSNGKNMAAAWFIALVWNALSTPMLVYLPKELKQGNYAILLGLIFPLIGIGFLVNAIHATMRRRRFGVSQFEMASIPGVVGGYLRGSIRTSITAPMPEGMRLTLVCVNRRITGSGKNRSAHERVLRKQEVQVGPSALQPGPSGTVIPVDFTIPYDSAPTDRSDRRNSIHWRLIATASLPGVDYSSEFEVPVFKTADSSAEVAAEGSEKAPCDGGSQEPVQLSRGITLGRDPQGALAVKFGAARNIRAGLSMTLFAAIFAGAVILPWKFGAPIIFPIVFGFFDLVLIAALFHTWFFSSYVVVKNDEVVVWRGMLGIGRRQHVPIEAITQIRTKVGLRPGTENGRAGYDIQLVQRSGKTTTIAYSIRNKREAEYLASELSRALSR